MNQRSQHPCPPSDLGMRSATAHHPPEQHVHSVEHVSCVHAMVDLTSFE